MEDKRVVSKTFYKRRDHVKFYTFHSIFRSSSTILIILVLAFMIYNAIRTTNTYALEDGVNNVILIWGMTGATISILPLILIIRVNDVVKQETGDRVESTDTIEVTKVKIQKSNDKFPGKLVISWNQIETICETKKYFYIYTGPKQGIFIVKKDITEGDENTFRRLAFENLKKQKGKVPYKFYFTKRIKPNVK